MTNHSPDIVLDRSQLEFCESDSQNIRLLAPAGCGKTASLLHRCRELVQRADRKPRFLIVTFTKTATAELKERVERDPYFEPVRGQANITTLNAWGWNRIRNLSRVSNPRLLTSANELFFAMKNQLHPVWAGDQHLEPVVTKPGSGARNLMTVMDNLKSMGFVHTRDVNRSLYLERLEALTQQGLAWRIDEQFELLTDLGVLDRPKRGDTDGPSTSRRDFYDRFFTFWRKATERLLEESTFTFEDQKYWNYLDIESDAADGRTQPGPAGAARYDHIMVDEFQDINPLDMALIKAIAQRHRATLTIVGDDDQAIFEWRGATPEYILHPEQYLGVSFYDYHLQVNYRSPKNIVEHSQRLISNNKNRVSKRVRAAEGADTAEIEVKRTDSVSERLALVTDLVRNTVFPGKVAVISRLRRQLIPYQIYFASDGAPFNTAVDLDVFNSNAFDSLVNLLEVWERSQDRRRVGQIVEDAILICDIIRRRPLSKKNRDDLSRHLRGSNPKSVTEAVATLKDYDGPKLSGKTHLQLHGIASDFLTAEQVDGALRSISSGFDGLQFDRERAEEDVFYTAPPLEQLADICENEGFSASDLIDRIDAVKIQVQEYRDFDADGNDDDGGALLERPLHLMTATRAKGKEFDTVILLDTVQGIWPYKRTKDSREMEAERRLFYVAFTRARQRVVMLMSSEAGFISPFVEELELPGPVS